MKKNRKIFVILLLLICGVAIFELVKYGKHESIKKYSVSKVYKAAQNDFAEINGKKIGNIDFKDCEFNCQDLGDKVYYLTAKQEETLTFSEKEYEEAFRKQFCYYFPDREFDDRYLWKHFPDLWEYIAANENMKMQNSRGAQFSVNRGVFKNYVYHDENDDEETQWLNTMIMDNKDDWFSSDVLIESSFIDSLDLNKKYQLINGTATASEILENYEQLVKDDPFIDYGDSCEIYVDRLLYYYKDNMGVAVLNAGLKYKGIPLDRGWGYGYIECANASDVPVRGAAIEIGNSKLDIDYISFPPSYIFKEEDTISDIIRLRDAINIFTNSLSDSNEYKVEKMEFVYRFFKPLIDENGKPVDIEEVDIKEILGRASWKFTAKNMTDEKDYVVYVDAETGLVSYFKAWEME